jgi:Rrf2 family protein
MLSKKAKYAIKALVHLARLYQKGPVLISDVSEKEHIPKKFLEAILLELRNNGLLQSRKGKGGGYYLIKSPDEISLATIVRLFDGPLALLPCVSLNYYERCEECVDEVTCGLRQIAAEVRDETVRILKTNTIQDIITKEDKIKG